MNNVQLSGNLTKDPELKIIPTTGKPSCSFTVATTRPGTKDKTDFISCVAFDKNAENIAKYFSKGRPILITNGTITTRTYDAADGTKRYFTEVRVNTWEFFPSGKKSDKETGVKENIEDGTVDLNYDADIIPVDDDDIPF